MTILQSIEDKFLHSYVTCNALTDFFIYVLLTKKFKTPKSSFSMKTIDEIDSAWAMWKSDFFSLVQATISRIFENVGKFFNDHQ